LNVVAAYHFRMDAEQVRIWHPNGEDRFLVLDGRTTGYAIVPRNQYVFGLVSEQPMLARRGARRWLVEPGQVVAWDPSQAHAADAVGAHPWAARLMIIDSEHLITLASDPETELAADLTFPEPVLSHPELARGFLRLHAALTAPTARLERDEMLAEWLRAIIERLSRLGPARTPLKAHDRAALRLAQEYLGDQPERNISLTELADAAGIGKFRLLRLFRENTGLPPHALQLAHRIRRAQRLLESGHTPSETATATGFADQSHMHRHFHRSLGMTPRQYQNRLTT